MSLVITTYVPEGIVMASDSRRSITIDRKTPDGKPLPKIDTINSDNVYKTFLLTRKDKKEKIIYEVGVQSFGHDLLGGVPTGSHIKRFSEEELVDEDDVTKIPQKIVDFFRRLFPSANIGFHVAGYKKEGKVSVPYVYYCHISENIIQRKNLKPDNSLSYGATWSGQIDVLSSIINPVVIKDEKGNKNIIRMTAPIMWDAMALQDAIDFSIYAIRTTIDTMRFQARPKNVGGPIDVLVITPDGSKWIQRKELKGV